MHDGFHPPLEEYLEAVYELQEEGTPVIQARLAERLGHAPPSVSEMIGRLRGDGFLEAEGRALRLTSKGRKRAESVVRKHRLAERLLTDVIGLEWHKTHLEACRWEHVISDDVEARLVVLLGNPSTCPHGNPIPGAPAAKRHLTALAKAEPGDHVRLERVTEQVETDTKSLTYLDRHGFIPGADAEVTAKSVDGTLTLEVDETVVSIEADLAAQLYVAAS
ncbi:MAG: metal-dependent transcriptional regulator [Acidimicrobiia bacterium]|nr:metal-dependent transcriptional regulator [Acidimicrobiia bacterium]